MEEGQSKGVDLSRMVCRGDRTWRWGSQENPTVGFSLLIIGLDFCLASGNMLERQVYLDWGGNHDSVVGLGMLLQRMRVRTLMPSQRSGLGTCAVCLSCSVYLFEASSLCGPGCPVTH